MLVKGRSVRFPEKSHKRTCTGKQNTQCRAAISFVSSASSCAACPILVARLLATGGHAAHRVTSRPFRRYWFSAHDAPNPENRAGKAVCVPPISNRFVTVEGSWPAKATTYCERWAVAGVVSFASECSHPGCGRSEQKTNTDLKQSAIPRLGTNCMHFLSRINYQTSHQLVFAGRHRPLKSDCC